MTYSSSDLTQSYIDGRWTPVTGTQCSPVINPATETPVAMLHHAGPADVEAAVAAAKRAHLAEALGSKDNRVALLERIRAGFDSRREDLAQAISLEMGAPIDLSRNAQAETFLIQLDATLDALRGFDFAETLPNGDHLIRQPTGVAGLITPWNWPIHQISLKVFAALAADCPVVLKPSEHTPLNARIFAEILDAAGLPPGAFNLINGDGASVGAQLTDHPDVAVMSFTGSTRAGLEIGASAVRRGARCALEMGGKSPCLVFEDADLDQAMEKILAKTFPNSGQNCNAPTRILIEASAYPAAKEAAQRAAALWTLGDPAQSGDHLGPVANGRQFDHIQTLLHGAIAAGATVLCGGAGRPDGMETGYFVKPTILADVARKAEVVRQEIFGPVIVLQPFEDLDDAIAMANDSEFGLAGYVYSNDPAIQSAVIRQLDCGMVFVNGADLAPGSPFGGTKKSGIGREGGRYGVEEFLELKLVAHPA
ncbi:aldehyde dehydrogenase (plasmid) [Phaeobacter inhibens]|uniref:aldehyde dehydrogenase family protein n=1 Tax=Phaeobacter inhibens TaxID=221822 RepID=UPI000C99DC4A|nr:aldehyde dehydrogenase family protein [Phaeobacter inhibens]AUR06090.1 aldehyde dehydrogenase [Phaeobacter inhibens]